MNWQVIIPIIIFHLVLLQLYIYNRFDNSKFFNVIPISIILIMFIIRMQLCIMHNQSPHIIKCSRFTKLPKKPIVISYNIDGLPDKIGNLYINRKSPTNTLDVLIESIKHADIIMLQELFYNGVVKKMDVVARLLSLGYDIALPPSINFWGLNWLDSGLLIATKGAIESVQFESFGDSSSVDSLMDKGILMITSGNITIANTHLQSWYQDLWPNDGFHDDARQLQLLHLDDFLPKNNIIVGGDFNFRTKQEENIPLFKNNFISQLDGIFSSYTITNKQVIKPKWTSDHEMLQATISRK